jgi:hypothetical protein
MSTNGVAGIQVTKGWQDRKKTDKYRFIMEIEPTVTYKWSNGATTSSTTVSPLVTTIIYRHNKCCNYKCRLYTNDVVVTLSICLICRTRPKYSKRKCANIKAMVVTEILLDYGDFILTSMYAQLKQLPIPLSTVPVITIMSLLLYLRYSR